jgi:hypothetical protein
MAAKALAVVEPPDTEENVDWNSRHMWHVALPDELENLVLLKPETRGTFARRKGIDPAKPKPVKRAVLPADIEPLVDEHVASAYLGYAPITCLRMAKRGQVPAVPCPVGNTSKIRYKFRLSELQAYTDSLSRAARTRAM